MRRWWPALLGVAGLAAGVVIGLYGLLAILYNGDGGGNTTVRWFGRELDADLVGALALAIGLTLIALSVSLLRRRRSIGRSS